MTHIQSLSQKAGELNDSVNFWNTAVIVALILAALAGIAVVVTTRLALVRAKQLGSIQEQLLRAKDDDLALNLKDKDLKIAQAGKLASEAAERAEKEKEKIARIHLQQQLAPRRLTG